MATSTIKPVMGRNELFILTKNTTSVADTVVFDSNNANRYTGILFITENNGWSSITAVSFKAGFKKTVSVVHGSDRGVTIADNGNIAVPLSQWSEAKLLSSVPFT